MSKRIHTKIKSDAGTAILDIYTNLTSNCSVSVRTIKHEMVRGDYVVLHREQITQLIKLLKAELKKKSDL